MTDISADALGWTQQDLDVHPAGLDALRIRVYRRGTGPIPLVLVHGATDSALAWTPLARALSNDFSIVAYDGPSHGDSETAGGGVHTAFHYLPALVQQLGLDRPVVLGHSWGGACVAAAIDSSPELFRCAILEDPPWTDSAEASAGGAALARIRETMSFERSAPASELSAYIEERFAHWTDEDRALAFHSKLSFQKHSSWVSFPGSPGYEWGWIVPRLKLDVLLITGGDADNPSPRVITPALAAKVAGLSDRIRVETIESAGHGIHREAQDQFVALVTSFAEAHAA
ncbi:MAG: alpha/beta hydrolase fold [Pseudonocardiales bacterium]|nr:alpha/beta hydrolase fold [Pseudonocardiales bacterium]